MRKTTFTWGTTLMDSVRAGFVGFAVWVRGFAAWVRGFWVLLLRFATWNTSSWVHHWNAGLVFWSLVFSVSPTMVVVDFFFFKCHAFLFKWRRGRTNWGVSPIVVVVDFFFFQMSWMFFSEGEGEGGDWGILGLFCGNQAFNTQVSCEF